MRCFLLGPPWSYVRKANRTAASQAAVSGNWQKVKRERERERENENVNVNVCAHAPTQARS
jgi:hypothetical protein